MEFNRLSIIGVGLLGGSIGLAVRAISSSCKITGYGHRAATMDRAVEIRAVDSAAKSIHEAVADADLVVICTPVGRFEAIFREIAPHLAAGAIVTDVGSTKRSAVALAEQILPAHAHFVGSHPMAGSEKRGIDFARADLFDQAVCIVTPSPNTHRHALAAVEGFWTALGMKIERRSPEEHDALVGSISHLPHAVAAALMQVQTSDSTRLAGKGFLDATRIAAGESGLWTDILLDNSDNVRLAIDRLEAELLKLKGLLDPQHADELRSWLASAAAARDELG